MNSIAKSNDSFNVSGIGVTLDEGASHTGSSNKKLHIYSIVLQSRKLTFLPKVIRHIFTLFELTFKMFFKAMKLKPKVIHCNDTLVLPLGVMVKFFTGAKLIYDAHELESDRNGLTKVLSKLTLFTEKVLWRFIDALIIVSPSIEQWYKEHIGKKYSEIILNSPILEKNVSFDDTSYLREHFSISEDSKIFLYIGILGQGRGIELITDAFKNNNLKSSLVFLGYGELSEELKMLSKEYPNIYVHDAVPHEKVVPVAKSADVGLCLIQNVSLSDYYCLPNKLFEYCFAEIPVLASDFPDISKIVKQYGLGKCSTLDSESIYKTIKVFEEMETLPKINADDLYPLSWGAQEEKLIKLYNKLIGE
jgi:glycosyltransferase involved in cell wall biosynthesis